MFQSIALLANSEDKTTLMYRGVTYELPKNRAHHPRWTFEGPASLSGKELIYRGVRYKLTPTYPQPTVSKIGKQLMYRGFAYETVEAA